MSFNSIDFLIFLPIVVLAYFVLPRKIKNYWLLVASYYFYMCWNAQYALLIFTSTAVTYASGLIMDRIKHSNADEQKKVLQKKLAVAGSLVINLGILFFFKYFNFASSTLQALCDRLHISVQTPRIDVLLPVGISFYTFQALSYTIDVYRDDIYAEKNFFRYALFVSFFPQLVAGPIERSKNLLKQLAVPHRFSFENLREGILMMLWGYFLKIVVADRVGIFVETVYGDITKFPGVYLIVATLLFSMQTYGDFFGYSMIAMGAAKILGITLMDNFRAPFLSLSVAELWRNWHISLTTWFRDYLYIPLGGSRKGKFRKYLNIMIIFLVSGLWHGAALHYVVWGGLNGFYQVVGDLTKPVRDRIVHGLKLHRESIGHRLLQMMMTFFLFNMALAIFRASSFREGLEIIRSMFTTGNIWILFDGSIYKAGLDAQNFSLVIVSVMVVLFADICKKRGISLRKVIFRQDWWVRCLFFVLAICVILLFGKWGPEFDKASFIYFQF